MSGLGFVHESQEAEGDNREEDREEYREAEEDRYQDFGDDDKENYFRRRYFERKRETDQIKETLSKMMFGYGDSEEPLDESVTAMEGYMNEFVLNVCKKSLAKSQRAGSS